jgi:predicted  nucleic acid-binding Zn-ribbon protein
MDFQDYADREVAALADRLTKAAAAAADRAAAKAEDEGRRALDSLRAQMQGELKKLAEDGQKAADTLRGELQNTVKQKAAIAASLKETQTELDAVRGQLAAARGEIETLRGALDDVRGELDAARKDFKTAAERGEVASRQLADARQTNEKLENLRDELTLARDDAARGKAAAEGDLRKTREQLEATVSALTAAEKKLEKAAGDRAALEETLTIAHSQTEAAEAKLTAVTDLFNKSAARVKVLEREQQDHGRRVQELEARLKTPAPAPAASTATPVPLFDDLLAGFQALESAATMSDVLTTFVEQLAAQFSRIALFRVRKNHLQGEHQIGFDLKTDIGKVVLPVNMDSLPARAVSSGLIERLSGSELKEGAGAPFSGSPSFAVAIPIITAGETLAVVYADDAGSTKGRRAGDAALVATRFAEAMQYHAVALLLRMTNELKARAELQTYAQSLLRELEEMYSADLQAGKQADDLLTRLQGNLDYARSIFESRVALEGGGAAALLDDEIAALLESAPDTRFAGHLAAVSGRSVKTRNAAEAS